MERLLELLSAQGTMLFADFVAQARSQGLRPELWLRAKHAGQLHTTMTEDGILLIAIGAQPSQEGQ